MENIYKQIAKTQKQIKQFTDKKRFILEQKQSKQKTNKAV